MASCGADGAVKLWSLDSDEPIADIEGQCGVWTLPSFIEVFYVELVSFWLKTNVSDPYSFDTDPDPIRILGFDDQKKKKKNSAEKQVKFFWDQKLQFSCP